jgi:predicted nucleotidyltransferase
VIDQDKEQLGDIIKKRLPQVRIYLFGSRARGDNRPESDIDLALDDGKKISLHILGEIREEIEESLMPYSVDIVDLQAVSSDFKKRIMKDGVVWS